MRPNPLPAWKVRSKKAQAEWAQTADEETLSTSAKGSAKFTSSAPYTAPANAILEDIFNYLNHKDRLSFSMSYKKNTLIFQGMKKMDTPQTISDIKRYFRADIIEAM
ncbi:MAG: hypothetical protein JWM09_456 [Francisellaceae bacterium]|nr:hypothetical protein [Francisellaceae bacterium]